MGIMKNIAMSMQQEFAEYKYIKDGCPESDAKKENWESMVKSFFDGDENTALDEFEAWSAVNLLDPTVNMNILTQAMLSGSIISFNTKHKTVCGKIIGIRSIDKDRWIITTDKSTTDQRGEDHIVKAG